MVWGGWPEVFPLSSAGGWLARDEAVVGEKPRSFCQEPSPRRPSLTDGDPVAAPGLWTFSLQMR